MNSTKTANEIVYIAQLKGSLRLSSDGVWFHNEERFQNQKLSALFSRSIVFNSNTKEYLIEIGNQQATFTCDDTPYFINSIDDSKIPWILEVSDGSTIALDPASLVSGDNGAIYCTVHDAHKAKFLKSAHQTLAHHVVSDSEIQIGSILVNIKS